MRSVPLSGPRLVMVAAISSLCALAAPSARAESAAADSVRAFPPPRVRAWQTGLLKPDRLQHASLSFTLAAGATLAGAKPVSAFAGTLAIGLAKELWDARSTRFDAVDLAADAFGAALGASAGDW